MSTAGVSRPERRIVLARDLGELWLGLLDHGTVVELAVTPEGRSPRLGAVVKAAVTRVEAATNGFFLDAGFSRDVFAPLGPGAPRPSVGDEVIVQIDREAQGEKGWRATLDWAIGGWALVLVPRAAPGGVSRRVVDLEESARLRELGADIAPAGCGLIVRAAAAGLSREDLVVERDRLVARRRAIEDRAREWRAPATLAPAEDPGASFVREHLAGGLAEIVVEGTELAALRDDVAGAPPALAPPLRAHTGPLSAVDAWGLERALADALRDDVALPGGGRLAIQTTEALTAIDVNSGREGDARDPAGTALRTNREAAAEAARQVRLRGIGGLIAIDFIDVNTAAARAQVEEAVRAAFAADRLRTRVAPLSEFCVAEVTRQRRGPSLAQVFTVPCPCCGRGVVLRPDAEARRLLRELRRRRLGQPAAAAEVAAAREVLAAARDIAARWGEASGLPPVGRVRWTEGPASVRVE